MYEAGRQSTDPQESEQIRKLPTVTTLLTDAGITNPSERYSRTRSEAYTPPSNNIRLTLEEERALFTAFPTETLQSDLHSKRRDVPTVQLLQETNLLELIRERPENSPARREWIRILTGNETVKGVAVACYSRWATYMATQYNDIPLDWEDKVIACQQGLVRAVETFDPTKGWSFLTYSGYWMRNLLEVTTAQTFDISLSRLRKVWGIRHIEQEFIAVFGHKPTDLELELQVYVNADGRDGRPYVTLYNLKQSLDAHKKVFANDHLSLDQPLSDGARDTFLQYVTAPEVDTVSVFDKMQRTVEELIREFPIDAIKNVFASPHHIVTLAAQLDVTPAMLQAALVEAIHMADDEEIAETTEEPHEMTEEELNRRLDEIHASETRRHIAQLALSGKTTREIKEITGLSRQLVEQQSARLAAYGLPTPKRKSIPKDQRRREVAALLNAGQEQTEIAERLNLKESTVAAYLQQLVPPVPKTRAEQEQLRAQRDTAETKLLRQWLTEHPMSAYAPGRTLSKNNRSRQAASPIDNAEQ